MKYTINQDELHELIEEEMYRAPGIPQDGGAAHELMYEAGSKEHAVGKCVISLKKFAAALSDKILELVEEYDE